MLHFHVEWEESTVEKYGLEAGVNKKRFTGGVSKFKRGVGNISKKGGLDKKEVEKIQGRRIVTLHNMNVYVSTLHVYVAYITRKQSLKAVL